MTRFIATAAFALFATAAASQEAAPATGPQCGPYAVAKIALEQRYGETRAWLGRVNDEAVVEIVANPDTGSWTMMIVNPAGVACIVSSGDAWEASVPTPTGNPA